MYRKTFLLLITALVLGGCDWKLPISDFDVAKQSINELQDKELGNSWLAFARPISKPYLEPEAVQDGVSDGWILIAPSVQANYVTSVSDQITTHDGEKEPLSTRIIEEVIIADSSSFEDLIRARDQWYDESTDSVLWIDMVYVRESGVMYTIVPDFGRFNKSVLLNAPFELRCDATNESGGPPTCLLYERFSNTSETIEITEESEIINNISIYTPVDITDSQIPYGFGICREETNQCTLIPGDSPDPGARQRRVCRFLNCSTSSNTLCKYYSCEE